MSVTVLLELQSKPESVDELTATFENILPETRRFEGCQSVEVISNQDDLCNLVLIEKWDSRQHHEKYLAWRTDTGALETLGAMLAQPPDIRYYFDVGI